MTSAFTVHIVDDDEGVRESVSALLEANDHRVEAHPSGDAFLDRLGELAPGCVVLDINMPGRSGLEVQHELNLREAGLPVIVMTGAGDVETAVKAMKAGASDFIEKPYSTELLLEAVDGALAELAASLGEKERVRAARAKMDGLSRRELQVVQGLLAALPNKLIAHKLGISVRTVEVYRASLMEKLGARGLSTVVRIALLAGIRPLDEEETSDGD